MKTLSSIARGAQKVCKVNKHHDEIEVEFERRHDGGAPARFIVRVLGVGVFLHLLGVIGRKSRKDENAQNADGEMNGGTGYEDVNDAGEDDADEAHHAEIAHARQVFFCDESKKCQSAERAAGDEKRLGHGSERVAQEQGGNGNAQRRAVEQEQNRARLPAFAAHHRPDGENQGELNADDQKYRDGASEDELNGGGAGCDVERAETRDEEPQRHPSIDALHECGGVLCDDTLPGRASEVLRAHFRNPPGYSIIQHLRRSGQSRFINLWIDILYFSGYQHLPDSISHSTDMPVPQKRNFFRHRRIFIMKHQQEAAG